MTGDELGTFGTYRMTCWRDPKRVDKPASWKVWNDIGQNPAASALLFPIFYAASAHDTVHVHVIAEHLLLIAPRPEMRSRRRRAENANNQSLSITENLHPSWRPSSEQSETAKVSVEVTKQSIPRLILPSKESRNDVLSLIYFHEYQPEFWARLQFSSTSTTNILFKFSSFHHTVSHRRNASQTPRSAAD